MAKTNNHHHLAKPGTVFKPGADLKLIHWEDRSELKANLKLKNLVDYDSDSDLTSLVSSASLSDENQSYSLATPKVNSISTIGENSCHRQFTPKHCQSNPVLGNSIEIESTNFRLESNSIDWNLNNLAYCESNSDLTSLPSSATSSNERQVETKKYVDLSTVYITGFDEKTSQDFLISLASKYGKIVVSSRIKIYSCPNGYT
ncbi:hypothetical protein BY996DRAFT_6410272 [Phakopsora pachyrhizi]|nr:hypothetical protein BY996DRAFT_6410272 [Phakopsora pachyrhizi]